jgi:hypothetical protein
MPFSELDSSAMMPERQMRPSSMVNRAKRSERTQMGNPAE